MLNCTLNQREDQYQNLNNFTEKTHEEIMDITSSLGWTVASIDTDVSKSTFPNPENQIISLLICLE